MAGVKGHPRTKKHYQVGIRSYRQLPTGVEEYVCQCPRCLTLETVWFKDGALVPTTKFSQGKTAGYIMIATAGRLIRADYF